MISIQLWKQATPARRTDENRIPTFATPKGLSRLDGVLANREVLLLLRLLERLERLLLRREGLADGARLLEAQVERHQVLVLVEHTELRLLCLVDHRQHARNRLPHHLAARRTGMRTDGSAPSVQRVRGSETRRGQAAAVRRGRGDAPSTPSHDSTHWQHWLCPPFPCGSWPVESRWPAWTSVECPADRCLLPERC